MTETSGGDGRPSRRLEVILAGFESLENAHGAAARARSALQDSDPEVRAAGLGALARLGAIDGDDLAMARSDDHPAVRMRACELSTAVPADHALVSGLCDLLEDPEAFVVEVAAFSCGELDSSAHRIGAGLVPPMVARLCAVAEGHNDPLCRESAVAALGAIGDPAGLPTIIAACSDKPAIRRRAVIALTPFDGPGVDEALRLALEDRDWQVRQFAEDILE